MSTVLNPVAAEEKYRIPFRRAVAAQKVAFREAAFNEGVAFAQEMGLTVFVVSFFFPLWHMQDNCNLESSGTDKLGPIEA